MQKLRCVSYIIFSLMTTFALSQQWQYKAPMTIARKGMAVTVFDQKIWVIGGSQIGNSSTNVVEVYDPLTDTWDDNYPTILVSREDAVAQTLFGKIYLFGGSNQMQLVSEVECYDPNSGDWQVVSNLPTPRRGLTSVIVDSSIWLIGGSNLHNTFYNLVEIYHPLENSWDSLGAALNYARSDAMASTRKFGIFVFGGNFFGPIAQVEWYNPFTNIWESIGSMLFNCSSAGYTSHNNQSWIIGGIGLSGTPLDRVQVFIHDSSQVRWQEGPPLNTPRRELVAATVNNRLYAIGGRGLMGHNYYNIVEELDLLTNINAHEQVFPTDYVILTNYPNPFNSSTTIQCKIPQSDKIYLSLYTATGQKLTTIYEGELPAGLHSFDLSLKNFSGIENSSGLYFIHLKGRKFSKTHKIFLMK